jgi:ATP phosphoribosyltransferase
MMQGPTVSPVYTKTSGSVKVDYYAIIICVPKPKLYHAVRQLRKVLFSEPIIKHAFEG